MADEMIVTREVMEQAYAAMTAANADDYISETGMCAALEVAVHAGQIAGLQAAANLYGIGTADALYRDRIKAAIAALEAQK